MNKKCGCLSACLTVTTSSTFFATVGQIITFTYNLTNTGTIPLCEPLFICDSLLGGWQLPGCYILPHRTESYSRTYSVIASDLTRPVLESTAVAHFQIKRCKWLSTNEFTTTLTNGSADLSGTLSQSYDLDSNTVTVQATINNSASSGSAAANVNLTLLFPVGVLNVIAGPNSTIIGSSVVIATPSLAIGATLLATFTYQPSGPGAYTWNGNIISTTFDPNGVATVSNVIIIS